MLFKFSVFLGLAHFLTAMPIEAEPALNLVPRDAYPENGYAVLPFKRSSSVSGLEDFTVSDYRNLYYLVELEVGTPGQKIKAMIDTGSSDLILESINNPSCTPTTDSENAKKSTTTLSKSVPTVSLRKRKNIVDPDAPFLAKRKNIVVPGASTSSNSDGVQGKAVKSKSCFSNGFFSEAQSSSFKVTNRNFTVSYNDGQSATGTYVQDDVKVGDISVTDFTFGLVESGDISLSVFGIGPKSLETLSMTDSKTYDNFPYHIKKQKNLKKAAFSVHFSSDMSSGRVLFGAVDKSKVKGDFTTLKYADVDGSPGFYISTSSVQLYYQGKEVSSTKSADNSTLKFSKNSAITTLLDTGSTLITLPKTLYEATSKYINYQSVAANGFVVDCSELENAGNFFRFVFNGKVQIDVPFAQFNLTSMATSTGCTLGLQSDDTDSLMTLGDPYFRSSYTVFDLESQQISIGAIADSSESSMSNDQLFLIA